MLEMFSFKKKKSRFPAYLALNLEGKEVAVKIKTHVRSKSYRLTILTGGIPCLTIPPYGKIGEAEAFLFRHKSWLITRLKHAPKNIAFIDGAIIPLRGIEHKIKMDNRLRGQVELITNENELALQVPGGEHHMARRFEDWLKKQTRIDVEKSVIIHCQNLEVKAKSISIRSQSSRWGSCSSSARLNFNWRLILAPSFVLDYVVAHEVAHLLEMNHSPAFWKNVEKTLPDMERGKGWLKKNGQELMIYGVK